MCTVSWLRRVDGYELFCNRDERRTRLDATPPRLFDARGQRFIAPVDGEAGGTWISVNQAGLALCLLNDYAAPEPAATDLRSRGLLVRELADAVDIEEFRARLLASALERLRGFVLLVLGPGRDAFALARWDTRELRIASAPPARPLLVSSAWNGPEVRAKREALFERTVVQSGTAQELRERHLVFHASTLPAHGALSPCMHRADASTVSLSRVVVDARRSSFDYRAGAPCEAGESVSTELERAERP